jgi:ribosomal protein S11
VTSDLAPHDPATTPKTTLQLCCVIHTTLKKNNIFVNLTNTEGQTILKFTAGSIRGSFGPQGNRSGKKSKKQPRTAARWIIEKISYFIRNNFDCVKIIVKACGDAAPSSTSLSPYLSELKRRKKLSIVYFQNRVPIVHNGCRVPRRRRV